MRVLHVALAALIAATACTAGGKGAGSTAAATPVERARDAARTANAIANRPAAADSILGAAGFTRETYQQLLYDIAADSAMSAEYASIKTR